MDSKRGYWAAAILSLGAFLFFFAGAALAGSSDIMVGVKHEMKAQLFVPEGPGPFPGVLVLHTSGGLQPADTAFAERLAKDGYVALVPAFLDAYGITARSA